MYVPFWNKMDSERFAEEEAMWSCKSVLQAVQSPCRFRIILKSNPEPWLQ